MGEFQWPSAVQKPRECSSANGMTVWYFRKSVKNPAISRRQIGRQIVQCISAGGVSIKRFELIQLTMYPKKPTISVRLYVERRGQVHPCAFGKKRIFHVALQS